MFYVFFFGLQTFLPIVLRYFLSSVVLGRSGVVLVVQIASNCSTLFWFVLDRSDGFRMFWRVLSCVRSSGCILVHLVFDSDSDSFNFS